MYILVDNLPKALNKDTISFLCNWNFFLFCKSKNLCSPILSYFPLNRIFKAVPRPWVCSLPHRRHLSHPTQSIILVIFLKCCLNSNFSFSACWLSLNMVVSSKWEGKDLRMFSKSLIAIWVSQSEDSVPVDEKIYKKLFFFCFW